MPRDPNQLAKLIGDLAFGVQFASRLSWGGQYCYDILLLIVTYKGPHGAMAYPPSLRELTAAELYVRAEGYAVKARDRALIESRETFLSLAALYTRMAAAQEAKERQPFESTPRK